MTLEIRTFGLFGLFGLFTIRKPQPNLLYNLIWTVFFPLSINIIEYTQLSCVYIGLLRRKKRVIYSIRWVCVNEQGFRVEELIIKQRY